MAEEKAWEGCVIEFRTCGHPLAMVTSLRYLGRNLTTTEYEWPEVVGNPHKEIWTWLWISRVLWREGEDAWVSGSFYLEVVHAILLFGSDMWVVTNRTRKTLGGFYHRIVMWIMGK